ncbi:MAG: hypothetical protein WCF22_21160, partial [Candidatus Sulfotelmatobacter sp.]
NLRLGSQRRPISRGETNRHFRSKSAGLFAQDDWKVRPNLTIGEGSASAGDDAEDGIFLVGLRRAISLRPARSSSSLISDSVAIALVPPAMMNCTRSVLRVGRHSAASSAAMRPLVPAPM